MKRIFFIDFLKGTAIFFLILIHVFSFYLDNQIIFKIWNFSHFVVVAFVFSSGFVLYNKYKKDFNKWENSFLWIIKRLKRLLIPLLSLSFFPLLFILDFS